MCDHVTGPVLGCIFRKLLAFFMADIIAGYVIFRTLFSFVGAVLSAVVGVRIFAAQIAHSLHLWLIFLSQPTSAHVCVTC